MSHEIINAMVGRRRSLASTDESRYGTLRLVVQTQGLDHVVCSVVKERIGGGRISGTRLAFARIPRRSPSGAVYDDITLLRLALESLASKG